MLFVYMLIQTNLVKLNVKLIIIGWVYTKILLVSNKVIYFGYFMPMNHGVNKKAPTIVYHQPSS